MLSRGDVDPMSTCFWVVDGLWQGDSWSALLFALTLFAALSEFRTMIASLPGVSARMLLYMDDLLLFCQLGQLAILFALLRRLLAGCGL